MSEPICVQTGITCGYPCWHKCPRYDEVKGKNFNQPNQCEQADVMRSAPFQKCGQGDNVCNCKNENECGYK